MGFVDLCKYGELEAVQKAIVNGVDVNIVDSDVWGSTGLMCALNRGHNNVVKELLRNPEIDVNGADTEGENALHWAGMADNSEGMILLLGHDNLTSESINHRNLSDGLSPIMTSVSYNSLKCFHLLLPNPKVDLGTRDGYERTAQEVCR